MARDRENLAALEKDRPSSAVGGVPTDSPQHDQTASSERRHGVFRAVGLGLITGAADDDCSAIGTYAAAGAKVGLAFLWTAPVTFPMMFAVVYLSAKLGQVSGRGLFHGIRDYFPRWVLYPTLVGVIIGNTIEAGADMGGMAAAVNVLIPIPFQVVVIGTALIILTLQFVGSYTLIQNTFRWLALALLAYVGAALLAKPELGPVLAGTFIPASSSIPISWSFWWRSSARACRRTCTRGSPMRRSRRRSLTAAHGFLSASAPAIGSWSGREGTCSSACSFRT